MFVFRFLSFLGIGRNDAFCAFIMHTAQDTFVAHVFQCEGSCSPLCKTIEAACKLRYQKCLDARPQQSPPLPLPPPAASTAMLDEDFAFSCLGDEGSEISLYPLASLEKEG